MVTPNHRQRDIREWLQRTPQPFNGVSAHADTCLGSLITETITPCHSENIYTDGTLKQGRAGGAVVFQDSVVHKARVKGNQSSYAAEILGLALAARRAPLNGTLISRTV